MGVETHLEGEVATIRATRQTGPRDVFRPRDQVQRVLRHGVKTVIFDLGGLDRIDRRALGEIVASHILAVKGRAKLRVVNVKPPVLDILRRCNVADIVEVEGAEPAPQG
jgi:anti-anti-sigma regulatory factor